MTALTLLAGLVLATCGDSQQIASQPSTSSPQPSAAPYTAVAPLVDALVAPLAEVGVVDAFIPDIPTPRAAELAPQFEPERFAAVAQNLPGLIRLFGQGLTPDKRGAMSLDLTYRIVGEPAARFVIVFTTEKGEATIEILQTAAGMWLRGESGALTLDWITAPISPAAAGPVPDFASAFQKTQLVDEAVHIIYGRRCFALASTDTDNPFTLYVDVETYEPAYVKVSKTDAAPELWLAYDWRTPATVEIPGVAQQVSEPELRASMRSVLAPAMAGLQPAPATEQLADV